jgi:hypothetical protein
VIETGNSPTTQPQVALWENWMELWNGNYAIADKIVADKVRLHLPKYGMPDPATIRDRVDLVAWIAAYRSSYADGSLIATELGPFVTDEHIICRWIYQGIWQSGRPASASAAPGTRVTLRGVDILRLEDGRIAEYWLSDDLLDVYVQLSASLPTP